MGDVLLSFEHSRSCLAPCARLLCSLGNCFSSALDRNNRKDTPGVDNPTDPNLPRREILHTVWIGKAIKLVSGCVHQHVFAAHANAGTCALLRILSQGASLDHGAMTAVAGMNVECTLSVGNLSNHNNGWVGCANEKRE